VEFCYGTDELLAGCTTATAAESPLAAGGSAVSVSYNLTGLATGTLYYFRASATNSIGTTDGSILSFTTQEVLAPAVTTEAADTITSSSAMLHGTVNPEWASATAEFCYGTAPNLAGCTTATAAESPLAAGGSGESVSFDLTGLTDNTTYYFRISATNTVGTTDGSILSFTTPEIVAPVVTSGAADTITSTSATLNGTVNPGWASTTVEFCYGTASDLAGCTTATAAESPLAAGDSDESVGTSLVELLPGTLYYFRVSATNIIDTTNGNILSFQTPDAPAVVTVDANTITSTSATLRGTVNAMWDTTAVSFCYGTDELLDGCTSSAATPASVSGSSTTNASKALTGLTPGTLYYFRVSGTNAVSTSDGEILSFRTPDAPTATTDNPDTITSTSVSLHGTVDPGWAATTVTFCYGTSASLVGCTSVAADESPLADDSGSVSVNKEVSGLTPGTLYYVRVRATNSVSTTNGEIASFRTPAAPDAISMTATDITPTSAMLYGTVHPGWDETSVQFCYGTAANLAGCETIAADEPTVAAENPTTSVFATLSELTEGTRYYYRVVATNTVGTDSGSILYFDTPSIVAPLATTVAASSVAGTTATLNASINPGWAETNVEFCYGTATNLAGCETVPATESPIVAGGSSVSVTADLTGLEQNTLYYFRVRAENSVGPTNGSILSFRTHTIVAPVAVTSAASVIAPTSVTLNGTVNPGWDLTSVTFCYGTSPTLLACDPVVVDESPVAAGGSAVPVSASLAELTADTTYYYRTMTENSVSTANGTILSFHTPAIVAPLVVTVAASVVLSETATLNGTVNPGWDETAVTFCYGTASNLAGCSTVTATESPVVAGGTVVNASADLTGLTADTTYYFRIIGENTVNSANGTILSFHTNAVVAPTVITSPATSITLSTATLNGTVNPGWAETDATFCYGTASDLVGCATVTADESLVAAGGSAVPVSAGITGLAPDTTYYFQASGENATGAASGIVRSFRTQVIAAPVATSAAATSLTTSTATLNGTVNPSWAETTVTFCYGTAADLAGCTSGAATPATVAPSGSVTSVSKALTGLSASTTYYFRTSATNSNSTALGSILSFTTTAGPTPTPSASNTPKPSNSPSPVPSPSVTPTPAPSVSPSASPDGGWVFGNWDDISKVLGIALLASGGLLLLAALRSLFVAVAGRRSRRTRADEEWSRYNV
jgi:phosphodiesterase/alkaline phosphatase D-like protein